MWADTVLILFISVCTALLSEGFYISNIIRALLVFTQIIICNYNYLLNFDRFDMADGIQN